LPAAARKAEEPMARFSRGVRPEAIRDLRRILDASVPYLRPVIRAAAQRLLDEMGDDPHLKGSPTFVPGFPHMRRLDWGPLRIFFWVRQPPLIDLYAEVVGFSRI
jgi:hypothetical protein